MAAQASKTAAGQPVQRKLISALLAISFGTILEWVSARPYVQKTPESIGYVADVFDQTVHRARHSDAHGFVCLLLLCDAVRTR